MSSLDHFLRNPEYGSGAYRRTVRLAHTQGRVLATINDTHHAMWLMLTYEDGLIVGVEAKIERGPSASCAGAPGALASLIGASLDMHSHEITQRLPPTANCTHLGDLVRLALRAARSMQPDLKYEIVVPDLIDDGVWISIKCNDRPIHRWFVRDNVIVYPEKLAGRPIMRGFYAWAREQFTDDDLDAAVMLQRGTWVARGRAYVVDVDRTPLNLASGMRDACFSYSGERWKVATNNVGYVRDFTAGVFEHPLPSAIENVFEGALNGSR